MIHASDAELASGYDDSMAGNATFTIDRSSDAMNVPRAVTMNTARDRRPPRAGSAVPAGGSPPVRSFIERTIEDCVL